MAAKK